MTAILVDADPANRDDAARALAGNGVQIVAQLDHVDQLAATLGRVVTAHLVVVSLEPEPRETIRRLNSIIRKAPAAAFIALGRAPSAELVIDAIDAGVKAFVPLPLDRARLIGAVDRLVGEREHSRRARIIQFVPTIGGCGATTIACGMAAALAKIGKTLIVDLDLVRGAVANGLDVRPRQSVADVAAGGASPLDKAKLDGAVAVHRESGLAVLARPEAPEDAQRVTREGVEQLLATAGAAYDFVVLDAAMSFDPAHAAATRAADVNVPVMQLTVPSAKNAERYLHALRRMGIDAARTQIVVNRCTPERSDIQPVEIERALGLKIAWTLPNDFPTALASINFGEPVTQRSPRTELSRSIVGLAQLLSGRGAAAQSPADEARHQVRSPT